VTDIVLNLQGVVCGCTRRDEVEAPLVVTGPGEITAKTSTCPRRGDPHPDLHIATLEKKTKLELYMTIGRGRGYLRPRRTSPPINRSA